MSKRPSAALRAELTRPSSAYLRHAWLALAGLLAFMAAYLGLAGWFARTAWRLTFGHGASGDPGSWIAGIAAALLSLFMLKGLFFVRRSELGQVIEIKPADQPRLFELLHRIADKAGAPRPHKVFLCAGVTAHVTYDLSLLSLVLPTRKYLVIGAGLVQALNLAEFRAVLAHEFGHFAQRATAVGRWVYIARQVAGHLVSGRGALDRGLAAISRWDLRVAWFGWLVRIVLWAVRSLVDTALRLVTLGQRALSREMEFNADLVAVSLTGSDAIVHALSRLQAADDAWARAVNLARHEQAEGRPVADLFALQQRCQAHMARLLNDPTHGVVPPVPEQAAAHRVFEPQLGQAPSMWSTHPANHERELNAKRVYVAAPLDERSSWTLFEKPAELRDRLTSLLLERGKAVPVPLEQSLQRLDEIFLREPNRSRYRGLYFGRSPVRHSSSVAGLWQSLPAPNAATLAALYPPEAGEWMVQLRRLEEEEGQLRALLEGRIDNQGRVLTWRGRDLSRKEWPGVLAKLSFEVRGLRRRLRQHDLDCRSQHLAVAAALGRGWKDHLLGLLDLLHYASHAEAALRQREMHLRVLTHRVAAGLNVGDRDRRKIVAAANELHNLMRRIEQQSGSLRLDDAMAEDLGSDNWTRMLGELKLVPATEYNIGDWLNASHGWVDQFADTCRVLAARALARLLTVESELVTAWHQGKDPGNAPFPSSAPTQRELRVEGDESIAVPEPTFWARFQAADGWLGGGARLLAAGAIVAGVLGFGHQAMTAELLIYNGLMRTVEVKLDGQPALTLPPAAQRRVTMTADQGVKVETRTQRGELIEAFEARIDAPSSQQVYNVAAASALVEWTAIYGARKEQAPRPMGTPRWLQTEAQYLFEDPPSAMRTKSGGATASVLQAVPPNVLAQWSHLPGQAQGLTELSAVHARWDLASHPQTGLWWAKFEELHGVDKALALLKLRRGEEPQQVLWMRLEQEGDPAGRQAVCTRQLQEPLKSIADRVYLQARCLPRGAEKDEAFLQGAARYSDHEWLGYAAGSVHAEHGRYEQALAVWQKTMQRHASQREALGLSVARLQRLLLRDKPRELEAALHGLEQQSSLVKREFDLMRLAESFAPWVRGYRELADGRLEAALKPAAKQPLDPRLLRLVAASDEAQPQWAAQALAGPIEDKLDSASAYALLGLAARSGQDVRPWLARLPNPNREVPLREAVGAFLAAVRAGKPAAQCEALLDGLDLDDRAQAFSLALIVQGRRAPAAWRVAAQQLLFPHERPNFK